MNIHSLVDYLKIEFEKAANPVNASYMKSYMKGQYNYYGIKSPERKIITSNAWKNYKIENETELYELLEILWNKEEREWQYVGMGLMGRYEKLFTKTTIVKTESLIIRKSWWDTVDWLASNAIGTCFQKFPNERDEYILKWMSSGDIWLIRTCLIFQLKYRENTNFDLIKKLILDVRGSNEFFINKAAGWALRQYSRFRPDLVREFIEDHQELHPLTIREGGKYC